MRVGAAHIKPGAVANGLNHSNVVSTVKMLKQTKNKLLAKAQKLIWGTQWHSAIEKWFWGSDTSDGTRPRLVGLGFVNIQLVSVSDYSQSWLTLSTNGGINLLIQ